MKSLIWIGVVLIAVVLLAGAVRLIIGDRSKGRRRCPKCWHSMEGLPDPEGDGWTCPECGVAVERERDLHRTRRALSKGQVALGVLLLAIGVYAKGVHTRWAEASPERWVPSLPVIMLVPRDVNDPGLFGQRVSAYMEGLLAARAHTPLLPLWQHRLLMRRMIDHGEEDVWARVHLPEIWIEGQTIPVHLDDGAFSHGAAVEQLRITSPGIEGAMFDASFAGRFMAASSHYAASTHGGRSNRPTRRLVAIGRHEPAASVRLDVESSVSLQGSSAVGRAAGPVSHHAAHTIYDSTIKASRTFEVRLVADSDALVAARAMPTVADEAIDEFLLDAAHWELFAETDFLFLRFRPDRFIGQAPPIGPEACVAASVDVFFEGEHLYHTLYRLGISSRESGQLEDTASFELGSFGHRFADRVRRTIEAWKAKRAAEGDPAPDDLKGFTIRFTPRQDLAARAFRHDTYWVPAGGEPYLEAPLIDVMVR